MGIGKAVLLTILLLLVEAIGQLLLFYGFKMYDYPEGFDHLKGATIIIARVAAYSTFFYFFWKRKDSQLKLPSTPLSLTVLLSLLLIIVGTEFLNRPFLDLDRILETSPVNFEFSGFTTYGIYSAATALLIAPVFEELFFRKFLFQNLLLKTSFLTALLISSVLFSLIHWETPLNLIPALIFGLISAIILYKTGNIFYSILLHFLYNFTGQLINYQAELYSKWLNWLDFGILYWTLFIFGIILTLFALQRIPKTQNAITSEE